MRRKSTPFLFSFPPDTEHPSLILEKQFWEQGYHPLAGVDEAGRGPLAGPVVAAAVILPDDLPPHHPLVQEVMDSKLLPEKDRERLYEVILTAAQDVAWAVCGPEEIDQLNILRASLEAMRRAVEKLAVRPRLCLVDGKHPLPSRHLSVTVVKGDRLSLSIAAASIVAKVIRDQIMRELHRLYPVYGFDLHKGYPTAAHKQALRRHGPSPVHRRSFRGVENPS